MGRFYYVFLLFIALFLMVMYDQYDAFLLFLMLLLAPAALYFGSRQAGKRVVCSLSAPSHVVSSEQAEIAIFLKSPFLPFLSSLEVLLDGAPFESYEETKDGFIFYFTREVLHCGRFSPGKITFFWKDPFALFHFKRDITASSFLVYPRQVGTFQAALSALRRIAGSEDKEYFGAVEYKPGDNPHLINWKVTARKDEVYVRDSAPSGSDRIVLAADYERNDILRDTVGDALLSSGLALLSARIPFRFVFATGKGSVSQTIRTREDWTDALSGFLRAGTEGALMGADLSPYVPICYITGNPRPPCPPQLSPTVWCAAEGAGTALSGRDSIYNALGGNA